MAASAFDRWDGRFYYYALIAHGGSTVGKRVGTRMAILTDCTFGEGPHGLTSCKGFIGTNELTGWTKHKRPIDPREIVRKWRSRPDLATIRKEKRKLPIWTDADQYAVIRERIAA